MYNKNKVNNRSYLINNKINKIMIKNNNKRMNKTKDIVAFLLINGNHKIGKLINHK
jgi:hypothetical protein